MATVANRTRELLRQGKNQSDAAREFRVSRQYISQCLRHEPKYRKEGRSADAAARNDRPPADFYRGAHL